VNLTLLGGLGSLFFMIASFVVATISLRASRKSKEAVESRETAELGIVMLRWSNQVRRLAASNGWDQDPAWPPIPVEATPEYLRGKASASNNDDLTKFIETVQKFTKGDAK
jgi:hypothetical protein